MNLITLTNTSGLRLRIAEVRLVFEPGQTLKVHPATVQHPAVRKYIGGYLKQDTQVTLKQVEPKAPVTASVEKTVAVEVQPTADITATNVETTEAVEETPVAEETPEVAETEDTTPEETSEVDSDAEETSLEDATDNVSETPEEATEEEVPAETEDESGTLRTSFLAVPGITEANVDDVMNVFDTPADLATADRDMLIEVGINSKFIKRVLDWAATNN